MMRRLLRRLRPRRQAVLGLEVGAGGIRLALLERHGGSVQLRWSQEVPVEIEEGDYSEIVRTVRPLLEEAQLAGIDVACSPPWSSARLKLEEMPALSGERFAKAASLYFEREGLAKDRSVISHAIAQASDSTADGPPTMTAMMLSIDNAVLRGLESVAAAVNLDLRWVVPAEICQLECLRRAGSVGNSLLVEIGNAETRMILVSHGTIRLVRRLRPCAGEIIGALRDGLELDDVQASQVFDAMIRGELGESEVLLRAQLPFAQALERLVGTLGEEIERSVAYVDSRHGVAIDEIYIGGALAGCAQYVEQQADQLGRALQVLDPLAGLSSTEPRESGERPRFAMAVGAALVALAEDPERNLLASAMGRRRRSSNASLPQARVSWQLAGVLGLLIATIGGLELNLQRRHSQAEKRCAIAGEQLDALQERGDELTAAINATKVESRIEALRVVYARRTLLSPYLEAVATCLPDDAWLTQVSIQGEMRQVEAAPQLSDLLDEDDEMQEEEPSVELVHSVLLAGQSARLESLGTLLVRLENAHLLDSLSSVEMGRDATPENSTDAPYEFRIEGTPRLVGGTPGDILAGRTP